MEKVTHDVTFDIFIFLRNRPFQQNKAHGVDFSDFFVFLSEKSRQNISNEDLDIYIILARKRKICNVLHFDICRKCTFKPK